MIIVTGAGGFIGSNMVAELVKAGESSVVACDYWGRSDKWLNISKHFISDFVRPDDLLPTLYKYASAVRAVVHMGAISATTELDIDKLISKNIKFTLALWDFCTEFQIPFIYASSAATYGGQETGLRDDQCPIALSKLRPLNPYGWSKHATDCILMRRVADGEPSPPQWCGLKFFNVYGPNEYHKSDMQSVVAKFFADVRDGRSIKLFKSYRKGFKDGQQCRDFVYVKDCTSVMHWLLQNPSISGLFNVGTGQARTFCDFISSIALALDVKVDFDFIEMPQSLQCRYQYFTQADMLKLKTAGYKKPFYSVEDGVADYVINYLNAVDRYR